MGLIKSKPSVIDLVPRWCIEDDNQMGWVVFNSDIQKKVGVEHLDYIELSHKGNKINCKVMGPGVQGRDYLRKTNLNDIEKDQVIKNSIFMDSYFNQELGLKEHYPKVELKNYKKFQGGYLRVLIIQMMELKQALN